MFILASQIYTSRPLNPLIAVSSDVFQHVSCSPLLKAPGILLELPKISICLFFVFLSCQTSVLESIVSNCLSNCGLALFLIGSSVVLKEGLCLLLPCQSLHKTSSLSFSRIRLFFTADILTRHGSKSAAVINYMKVLHFQSCAVCLQIFTNFI